MVTQARTGSFALPSVAGPATPVRLPMRKSFPLTSERLDPARVRDKIRQELNRFSRNRHRQPLPEGFAMWHFECKIGPTADAAQTQPFKQLGALVDQIAATGAPEVYIQIDAVPAQRPLR
jgi:hypothetical protein